MLKAKTFLQISWDYVLLSIGTFLYCAAWDLFLIPNGISGGGLTGGCTILQFATGIKVSLSYGIINILLLIAGTLILGRGFGIKTIYCILLSTVLFAFLPKFESLHSTEGQFFYLGDNKILIAIIGGLIEAIGIGIIFERGGSTGGTDIVALIINKFWPVTPGKVYLLTDLFIISLLLLIPERGFIDMVYGYITMITFTTMLDMFLLGRKSTVQILVFSKKYEDIADFMVKEMDRGVTALNSVGWYSQTDSKVLLILAKKSQLHDITRSIKEIDSKAFMSVSPASSVYGEGFEEIKAGINSKKNKE